MRRCRRWSVPETRQQQARNATPAGRASAADREQVIEVLKVAFVQDRITKDELSQRIGKVLASQTYDDLDVLTAGIPAGLTRAPQPAVPARRPDDSKKLIRRASAAVAGTGFVLTEAAIAAFPHYPVAPPVALVVGSVAGALAAGLLAALLTLIKWVLDRSSGTQPSQGPPQAHAIAHASIPHRPAPRDSPGRSAAARGPAPMRHRALFSARHRQACGHLSGCARWRHSPDSQHPVLRGAGTAAIPYVAGGGAEI